MRGVGQFLRRIARVVSLILLSLLATTVLMRFAPGYFADSNEMDPQHAAIAREQLQAQHQQESSLPILVKAQLGQWLHGDLGRSRHFGIPVSELMRDRIQSTGRLLIESVLCGWVLALVVAVPVSMRRGRSGEMLIAAPSALLLAIPVGALAMLCLIFDRGGPVLVLSAMIAARDFKLVYRLLRHTTQAPVLLFARAHGMRTLRIAQVHLLPMLLSEFFALAMSSFVLALSACVPVEVIFDAPGIGQLAWSAAMNRDLPVLLAVTLLMAGCVGVAAMLNDLPSRVEASCV